ncbi:MAG: hypothetical protein NVV70_07495 [Cellulomonas sp.]|nr:hypothetical protein [Cellulomonas sp.]MCR6647973.1 hypothetical protein [Cellulomonas sp.]
MPEGEPALDLPADGAAYGASPTTAVTAGTGTSARRTGSGASSTHCGAVSTTTPSTL